MTETRPRRRADAPTVTLTGRRTGTDGAPGPAGGTARPPSDAPADEEHAAQQSLPFDEAADDPIPFSLTPRARRTVAPHAVPRLRVVHGAPGGTPERRRDDVPDVPDTVDDTRAARARALRRAGMGILAIAEELGVDDLLVRAWVGDEVGTAGSTPVSGGSAGGPDEVVDDERTGLALVRAVAAEDAHRLLRSDPGFAAGIGLIAGVVSTDQHAVTLTTSRPQLAARVIGWLQECAELSPSQVRVVLRAGPQVAGDLVRHRWATALGVPVDRVVHTRWRGAPDPAAEQALVRIPDPDLAATLAGWCDAVLEPTSAPEDDAF